MKRTTFHRTPNGIGGQVWAADQPWTAGLRRTLDEGQEILYSYPLFERTTMQRFAEHLYGHIFVAMIAAAVWVTVTSVVATLG